MRSSRDSINNLNVPHPIVYVSTGTVQTLEVSERAYDYSLEHSMHKYSRYEVTGRDCLRSANTHAHAFKPLVGACAFANLCLL